TQAVPYEHSRLTDIHRCTRINTELALFNVLLVVQNYPESLKHSSSPLSIAIDSAQQNAEYPLTLVASTEVNRLHVQLTFRTDVFPVDYVRQVGRHYLAALTSLLKSPATTHIHRLTLLSLAEQTLLLDTYATNPRSCPVHYAHQYFEAQVHHSPNAIALRDHAISYTYAQVHCLARGLAYRLVQNTAVGRDRTVVIVADLSVCLVIAQLAVWMSGGAFVVIDPQQPLARKQFIVADSQCVARALPQYTPFKTPAASWPLSDETSDAKLLPILAQVLDKPLDAAALDQTFFQLGGNSLLAFQLVARCRRAGMKLTIADITRTATILQLSQQ
ncbi:hypothetical protein H4R34_005225, partial [Dimargaris verticillata]